MWIAKLSVLWTGYSLLNPGNLNSVKLITKALLINFTYLHTVESTNISSRCNSLPPPIIKLRTKKNFGDRVLKIYEQVRNLYNGKPKSRHVESNRNTRVDSLTEEGLSYEERLRKRTIQGNALEALLKLQQTWSCLTKNTIKIGP